MSPSRRDFVAATAAGLTSVPRLAPAPPDPTPAPGPTSRGTTDRFDPWIEVDPATLRANVDTITRLTDGTPILAVIKNNAYGLGLTKVAGVLEPNAAVAGFAVVKAEAAIALHDAGIRKPILHMGMATSEESLELARRGIHLSLYTDDADRRVAGIASRFQQPVLAHLYLDTGLGRMGMPYHRATEWMQGLAGRDDLEVAGTFMAFTEEPYFDPVQLSRFLDIRDQAGRRGIRLGRLHAASSNGVYHLPDARLDLVRPGIAIYGAYPSRPDEERAISPLRSAVRMKARVVRVERLRPGDGVSYGRNYVAEQPVWTATIPAGHTDGVPRGAVNGVKVLIGSRLYPVIGAVSASHCIVELGETTAVQVGDVATLLGPDRPELEPNVIAQTAGISVYDVLMHLNPSLPRILI